ncbi:MAG: NAAT family transporter [Leptolyngbyaceae cyanobacterium]
MELVTKYFNVLMALLAIINPISVAPFFLVLTHHQPPLQRNKTARIAAIAVGINLIVCFFIGAAILKLFGIQIASFRVAGGLLLLFMGLDSAQGKIKPPTPAPHDDVDETSIAVVPLAIPMTTGAGTISAVIVYAAANRAIIDFVAMFVMAVLIAAIVYLTYRASPWLARHMGKTGMNIASRLSGLILASLGIQFIVLGVADLLQPISTQ